MKNKFLMNVLGIFLSVIILVISISFISAYPVPSIKNVEINPTNPSIEDDVKICAEIGGDYEIEEVRVIFQWENHQENYFMYEEEEKYCRILLNDLMEPFIGMEVYFYIWAKNELGNTVTSKDYSFVYQEEPTEPPEEELIIINEFESNPFGIETGNEWIELYNPNDFSVDISEWKVYDGLSSSHLIYTISSLTIISEGYYIIELDTDWLNNEGDFIILKNSADVKIDQTPTKADNENDNRTWQRVPDASDNWEFITQTRGFTNGEIEEDKINYVTITIKHDSHTKDFVQFCEPNWKCSGWGECNSGAMYRNCKDTNNCDFRYNKPVETTGCASISTSNVLVEENNNFILGILVIVSLILIGALVVVVNKL